MAMKLLKKPVEVEGVRWTGDNFEELRAFAGEKISQNADGTLTIATLEGDHQVILNAIVVKGVEGEFYPVDPSIFEKTFYSVALAVESYFGLEALSSAERNALADSEFAVPAQRRLPIHDAKHVKLAWDLLNATKGLSEDERASARRRILKKAAKLGVDTAHWKGVQSSTEDLKEDLADSLPPAESWTVDIIPYLLGQACEEACEVGQAAAKVFRFGIDSVDPRNGKAARDRLVEETNDFLGVVALLNEELAARKIEPIVGIGNLDLIALSIAKRRDNLVKEYEAGRYTLSPSDED